MKETSVADGPGNAGVFLGLPPEFTSPQTSRYAVIPVPFGATTSYGKGTDRGPAALIEASRYVELYDAELDCEPYECGIYTAAEVREAKSEAVLAALEERVAELDELGKIPLMIGGEHSLTAAPVRGLARRHKKFSVLQFDAHADLRDAYEGNPLSHASVMARVREVPSVTNIVAVGLRAIDREERDVGVREDMFFDHEMNENLVERVLERLPPGEVYVSFDVDAFGPELMPATGTPEPGGVGWWQALSLLRAVCEQRTVIGFDVVELAPMEGFPAPDFVAARLVYKMIGYSQSGRRE